MNDIGGLDARNPPQVVTAQAYPFFPCQPATGKRQAENKAANGKEQLHPQVADGKNVINRIAFNRGSLGRGAQVERTNRPHMKGNHRHDGNEAQSINLGYEGAPRSGDPGKLAEQFQGVDWLAVAICSDGLK